MMVLRPGTSEMSGSGGCLVISGWTRRRVTGGGRAVTGAVTETRTGAQTEIGGGDRDMRGPPRLADGGGSWRRGGGRCEFSAHFA